MWGIPTPPLKPEDTILKCVIRRTNPFIKWGEDKEFSYFLEMRTFIADYLLGVRDDGTWKALKVNGRREKVDYLPTSYAKAIESYINEESLIE